MLHKNRDSSFTCLSLQASRDMTWTGVTFSYEFLEKNILWKLVKVQRSFGEQTVGYRLSGNHITALSTGDNVGACKSLTKRHSLLSAVLTYQMPNFTYQAYLELYIWNW